MLTLRKYIVLIKSYQWVTSVHTTVNLGSNRLSPAIGELIWLLRQLLNLPAVLQELLAVINPINPPKSNIKATFSTAAPKLCSSLQPSSTDNGNSPLPFLENLVINLWKSCPLSYLLNSLLFCSENFLLFIKVGSSHWRISTFPFISLR